MNINNVYVKLE